MIKRILGTLLTSLYLSTGVAQAGETAGAGSTFVFPILEKWAAAYEAKTGDKIRYESIGSGAGITQIKAATVDFGASDMVQDCCGGSDQLCAPLLEGLRSLSKRKSRAG